MSADSRVVGSVCLIGDPELYAHGEFASVQMQLYGGYEPKIGDKLTPLSLLAEAESRIVNLENSVAAMRRTRDEMQSNLIALQSRLDAVLGWAAEVENYLAGCSDVVDGDYGQPAPNEEMKLLQELTDLRTANRRAALGCATTGEMK